MCPPQGRFIETDESERHRKATWFPDRSVHQHRDPDVRHEQDLKWTRKTPSVASAHHVERFLQVAGRAGRRETNRLERPCRLLWPLSSAPACADSIQRFVEKRRRPPRWRERCEPEQETRR